MDNTQGRTLGVNWLAGLLSEGTGQKREDVCVGLGPLAIDEYTFPQEAPGREFDDDDIRWYED